ncbi:HEAT repeat domain-containing protein [Haloferula sp. A504]|uniref:HEAT repeat domain-containing protein n=1 Tax=Haloferula sp. A504 TaxID=3373601 RepID=UPI0031CB05C9|nr:hypothetical protein [Verrucomicrobiaceae bacterium E54]
MKHHPSRRVGAITLLAGLSIAAAESGGSSLSDALKGVLAQCPEDYPEEVVAVLENDKLSTVETEQLLGMLESWNPSVRLNAAGELGKRGDDIEEVLRKGTRSENWMVRAGVTAALVAVLKDRLDRWQEFAPGVTNAREAQEKIRTDADLDETFVRLARDPRLEVRVEALKGISLLGPRSADMMLAVFELSRDDDPFLSQDAVVTLDKQFGPMALEQEGVVAALKEAMKAPLPRARGHAVNLITRMDEETQRQFIPELLAHLDWQPNRDTMFGAGGQAESIQILTKLGVKELVPRLPALMAKTMRGPGLFDPCLDSARTFGADARVILPELRKMMEETKPTEQELKGRNGPDLQRKYDKLSETVAAIEKS